MPVFQEYDLISLGCDLDLGCFQDAHIILYGDTCGNYGLQYLRKRAQNEQVHGGIVLKDNDCSLIL